MNEELVAAVDGRTRAIVATLRTLDEPALRAPSLLPGWSRLTIACHLRFGADAFLRLTQATRRGQPVAYYPEGRASQRPTTLVPQPGETAHDVVESLASTSTELHDAWTSMAAPEWDATVTEPDGNRDLGPLPLSRLPLLRLTEVEVHGDDLDIGLEDWSRTFVAAALPFRLEWLNTRRSNHRDVDNSVEGAWLLDAVDGPTYLVELHDGAVASRPADRSTPAHAVIRASSRDLLALLLGRPQQHDLTIEGDAAFAAAFSQAFPGP